MTLRTGEHPGPTADAGRVFALADAIGSGWTARGEPGSLLVVRPPGGPSFAVRWSSGFDLENAIEVFRDEVYRSDVHARVVVDGGAGTGDSALYFCEQGARRVYAFEPHPESFALAVRNVRASGWGERVDLREEALAGEDGNPELAFPADVLSAASLRPVPQSEARWKFGARLRVRARSLDSIVAGIPEDRIGLLKLDCQGAEYGILAAASSRTLARIDQIVLEYGRGTQDLPTRLAAEGYRVETSGTVRGYVRAQREAGVVPAHVPPGT